MGGKDSGKAFLGGKRGTRFGVLGGGVSHSLKEGRVQLMKVGCEGMSKGGRSNFGELV